MGFLKASSAIFMSLTNSEAGGAWNANSGGTTELASTNNLGWY